MKKSNLGEDLRGGDLTIDTCEVDPGDHLVLKTPGGGGYGPKNVISHVEPYAGFFS